MRFTLRHLEYFVAAGETGSITLASERINISQPSISTAISHLEAELGVQLFVRHHAQGLSLTPAGRRLLREAKHLLDQANGLYDVASEVTEEVRGPLAVGCMLTLAPMVIPELCHSFMASFPRADLRQQEGHQEDLFEGLRRARLDVALVYDLQVPKDIAFEPLVSLPVHVVVSEIHPMANRGTVSLTDLKDEPLILLDLPYSREYFLAMYQRDGIEPHIAARSAYPDVIRTMVANGYGYTLANVRPRSELALDGRRVVRVRLAGGHRPVVVGLATAEGLKKSRLLKAFETHCRTFISDGYIPGMVPPRLDNHLNGEGSPAGPTESGRILPVGSR
ncbi:LysR family transcriptional regulator [Oleomonas cavernae]|uniref:LysR family transcriptional regulator n=1 Tax=Oleomonas cavernae TaxID=2320859 RepID=A0A418W9K6_9PROT|nr:LysR family transcriptional regulator [Oleomonas cavernae]RJF86656.1 LysR family transcriptional regulator [Oleomonas cavernae]